MSAKQRFKTILELARFNDLEEYDPGNLSKLERGMLPPPESKEKLEEYASALGLKSGTDEWYQFFDLAAACKGVIPRELLENDELVKSLPIIFRTFRSKRVSKKTVEDLIERLRKTEEMVPMPEYSNSQLRKFLIES
jgi:hypothetical protein